MAAGHAGTGGIVKERERLGRGCACCPPFRLRENGRRTRQVARRTARHELRRMTTELRVG